MCKHSQNKRLWGRNESRSGVPFQSLMYLEISLSQKASHRTLIFPCSRCLFSDFTFYELFLVVKYSFFKSKALAVHL